MPVDDSSQHRDPWSLPTFLLWVLFLLLGLGLDPLYNTLREYAGVTTKTAFINNPLVLQIALAVYFARFAYLRAREARPEVSLSDSALPFLVLCIVALAAFWWVPYDYALKLNELSIPSRFWTIYVTSGVLLAALLKTCCWLYLLSLVFRFYVLQRSGIFARVFGMLPRDDSAEEPVHVVEFGDPAEEWSKRHNPEPRKEPVD